MLRLSGEIRICVCVCLQSPVDADGSRISYPQTPEHTRPHHSKNLIYFSWASGKNHNNNFNIFVAACQSDRVDSVGRLFDSCQRGD